MKLTPRNAARLFMMLGDPGLLRTLFFLGGIVLLSVGLGMVNPAAPWIVIGTLFVTIAISSALRRPASPRRQDD